LIAIYPYLGISIFILFWLFSYGRQFIYLADGELIAVLGRHNKQTVHLNGPGFRAWAKKKKEKKKKRK
jgi:hypothetical protein